MNKIKIGILSLILISSISACNKTTKVEREVVSPAGKTTVSETSIDNNSVKTEVTTDDTKVTTEVNN